MLPTLSRLNVTGVALQGVPRPGGRISSNEDTPGSRGRTAPGPMTIGTGEDRLKAIVGELRAPSSSPNSLAQRWRASLQASMQYKRALYLRERDGVQLEIDDAQSKLGLYVQQARAGSVPLADSQTSNWDISEKLNSRWQGLVMQAAALDRIIDSAQFRFDHVNNGANFGGARVAFAGAVEQLVGDFGSQGLLMEWVADLIDSFLNAPTVNSNSLINVLLLGNPGVGKTRLATTVAGVLGKLGLFVYDSVTVCGRSDFVAEFEGQVAAARGI